MNNLPNILIVNDGNRRWAKERNLPIQEGYREMVRKIAFTCDELKKRGFDHVYFTMCSVNNLSRPKEQVNTFFEEYLHTTKYSKTKLKIELHGNIELIPKHFKEQYQNLVNTTSQNTEFTLHYMVNWSMEDEISRIYNRLHSKYETINEAIISENSDIKEPIDLIIRTGKRKRLSSCVPPNSPFAEIFFLDILFPDIESKHIDQALEFFNQQERTFGV